MLSKKPLAPKKRQIALARFDQDLEGAYVVITYNGPGPRWIWNKRSCCLELSINS